MIDYDVIIPCYKGKKFINSCINDHLNQSLRPKNIIFINDGDNDVDENYVKSFFKNTNTNCVYIKNIKNIGAIDSINLGVSKIQSKYFKISAIDDKFDSCLAFETLSFLCKFPDCGLAISYPGYYIHNTAKKINISYNFNKNNSIYYDKSVSKKIFLSNFFKPHSQTIFFNTQIFKSGNIFKSDFGYMADLLNNYFIMLNHGFCIIPYNLAYYGLHSEQWSNNINRFDKNFHLKILNNLKENNFEFYKNLKDLKLYVDLSFFDILKINSVHNNFIGYKLFVRIIMFNLWNYLKNKIGIDKIYKIYDFLN